MSARYGNKVAPLITRKSSFFKKDRFDSSRIKKPSVAVEAASNAWVRPTDWLTMPTITSSEQKIAMLMPVYPQGSNFLAFTVAGAYTVDWGDGVIENVATGVKAQHEYSYADADLNPTVTSGGYKMAIVVVTPQAGQNITSVNFNQKYALTGSTFPDSSPILEIILSCPNMTSFTLTTSGVGGVTFCKNLINFSGVNMGLLTSLNSSFYNLTSLKNISFDNISNVTSMDGMFANCYSLTTVSLFNTVNVTNMANMFSGCASLTTVPLLNTINVTDMNGMFNQCRALTTVPLFNTANVTNMTSMFAACSNLVTVPLFNTANVLDMSAMFLLCDSLKIVPLFNTVNVTGTVVMFQACKSLTTVPLFNTANVTNMYGMFSGCSVLTSVPLFNTANVTEMSDMFGNCYALASVPLFNTASVVSMAEMFSNCYKLATVPLFDTANVTDMTSMFNSCNSLIAVPLFNTANVIYMPNMFSSCLTLTTVPLFNTANVTNMTYMFSQCYGLTTVPLFNTANVTDMNNMFNQCTSLTTVPLFNTVNVTNMTAMFNSCNSLTTVPLFNTVNVTSMNTMFYNCNSLTTVPLFNTANVTNMSSMFSSCISLVTVPLFNASAGAVTTKFDSIFSGCISLTRAALSGSKYSISYSGCKLSKEELESIFNNLDTRAPAAAQTLTITNNWGAPTPVTRTGTTTIGGTTITMANTADIAVGMQVTGAGSPLITIRSVTFTDAGDLVTLTNHGLSNGDEVAFQAITSTTGIIINKIYYVVNRAANTFQLAATSGGAVLPLTTNGTGSLRYRIEVVSINPNVNITVSRPTTLAATNSLTFRQLRTGTALLKGWTVTG